MKFTEIDKAILIGLMIGDGYINENGRIKIQHGEKQKEYVEWKAKLLHSVCGGKDIKVHKYERIRSKRKDGKEWKHNEFTTYGIDKQSTSFKQFRELLYKNGKKTISKEVLDLLNPTSIALWFLDDGCLSRRKNKDGSPGSYMLRICTYLPKDQNELIQKYFQDKYNITWNVVKADGAKDDSQWMLRCGEKEGRKFLAIIRDIVQKNIPSMNYKVLDI